MRVVTPGASEAPSKRTSYAEEDEEVEKLVDSRILWVRSVTRLQVQVCVFTSVNFLDRRSLASCL